MKLSQILSQVQIPTDIDALRNYIKNPLYRNSLYLTFGRFLDVGFGFLFWALAARLYSVADVGIATALIASLGLVIVFSRLGFDMSLIRFMPSHDHSKVFNSCLWITTMATVVVSIIYIAAIDLISPDIAVIRDYALLFILFAIVNNFTLITGNAFLSIRKADLRFFQNLIMGVRLPLLLPLVLMGSLGILFSFGFAYIVGAVFALLIIRGYFTLSPHIDWEFTQKTLRFSSLTYLTGLLQMVPPLVMPILIVNLISPKDAALYYIAFAIGNLVLIIPDAISTSFLVEGSHGINLRKGMVRSLAASYAVLVPAILFIVFFGNILLGFFGKDYLAAFDLLRVVVVSSLFVTVYLIFVSLQFIRLKAGGMVVLTLIRFVLLIGLSYVFLIWYGVVGAGYAWALTHVIIGAGIVVFGRVKGWI
jgi:O-antigen/teichoic acid export membrane protein